MSEQARHVLVELKRRQPNAVLSIGGQETPLFDRDDQIDGWLARHFGGQQAQRAFESQNWAMFRGGPARNAPSPGGRPLLNYRWRVRTSSDPSLIEYMGQLRESHLDQNNTAIPAMNPLAVAGVVLMRTSHNLLAVDFASGKRIWEVATDEPTDHPRETSSARNPFAEQPNGMDQRLWRDATFGTLSSDGECVYSIEDLSINPGLSQQQRMIVGFNGRRRPESTPKRFNRLTAHELKTEGKLKWALGGPAGDDELPLAEAFFLGPPLPLAGRLYVLAEIKGEIRLLAIDPRKSPWRGEQLIEWTLPLAVVERNVFDNTQRRLAGVSPSYADGVLVCPTGAGMVVGVDLTTRSMLWGRTYGAAEPDASMPRAIRMQIIWEEAVSPSADGWIDSTVTLVDGRALHTPVEGDKLQCLDLASGELIWEKTREECKGGLYVGCVEDGRVLVIGRTHARAFRLTDGQPLWDTPLPSGAVPSGRGFFQDGRYFLPLSSAEVVSLDLATGQEVDRARSRQGIVPGNLICYQGAVISQGVDSVDCFYQAADVERQVAAALEARPDDPSALTLSGEILLDQGRLAEARARLRRAVDLEPNPRATDLLVDALLEGLRTDFPGNQETLDEIEPLLERPEQWDAYLRLLASGLHRQGHHLPAFDAYLRLVDLKVDPPSTPQLESALSARRDRWTQARLAELRDSASVEDRQEMDARISARRQTAMAAGAADALREFLHYFGNQPGSDLARLDLCDRLSERESALEIELLLSRVAETTDASLAAQATARLAELLARLDRPDQAAWFYARLRDQFADMACRDGQTGRQLVDGLPPDGEVQRRLTGQTVWPVGLVEVSKQSHQGMKQRNVPIALTGRRPWADQTSIDIDGSGTNSITGRDGMGRQVWSVPLQEIAQLNQFGFANTGANRAHILGHLVLAAFGHQIVAIDALGATRGSARVLWKEDLSGALPGAALQFQQMGIVVPWGRQRIATDGTNRPLGMIGPCTVDFVCLMRGRNLMAVDPLTGKSLWTRQGVNSNSLLFGDDQVVLAHAPDDDNAKALVLRSMDGEELAQVELPPAAERMSTVGRHIVRWASPGDKAVLSLFDPWRRVEVWSRDFAPGAKAAMLGEEEVGVFEPGGRFTLLSVADGTPTIEADLDPTPNASELFLLPSRERLIVAVSAPRKQEQQFLPVNPVPGGIDNPQFNGRVYGFDRRSGQLAWSASALDQALLLSQPSELPVLVFASHVYKRDPNNNNNVITVGNLMCIDKRTGRVVHQDESPNALAAGFDLVARPEARIVELKLQQQTLSMKFTDRPLPPEATTDDESKGAAGSTKSDDSAELPNREDVDEDE
jgi:outer membrane protein assembly factor BamB